MEKKYQKKNLGIECITIGVPFMIDLKSISSKVRRSIIVSPKDNYEMINFCSDIVSSSLNLCFNPKLSSSEIDELKRPL